MELTKLWEIIRRRKWLVLQPLLFVTIVAAIASYFVKPTFEASSRVLFMPAQKTGFGGKVSGLANLNSFILTTNDLKVNRVLSTTRPYLAKMISRLQLRDEDGNLVKPDALASGQIIVGVKEAFVPTPQIDVRQNEDTNILTIKAVSPNPYEAKMMANTLGEIMVTENEKSVRAEYRTAREFVETQLLEVKGEYKLALAEMAEFMGQEHTVDLDIETKLAAEKMTGLLKEKEDTIVDLAEAHAKLALLKEQLANETPGSLSASILIENPQIDVLKRKLTELRLQLAQARSDLTEKHPRVLSLREQIKVAESELNKEVAVYRSSAPELMALERRVASLDARLKGISSDIDSYLKTLEELPGKIYRHRDLRMDFSVAQERYSALLDSLHRVELAEASTLSEIRLVEPAVVPAFPVSPNKTKTAFLAVTLGLFFGFGLAFAVEYLDDTIRTAEDAKELKQIALMGLVPVFKAKERPLISTKDPNDPLCESYRRIRNYPSIDNGSVRSLLITSPGPEEGKSTTVVNLGISMAREGKRVVLVDMDLRRASLHAYFNLPNQVGVTDVLQEDASLGEAVQDTQVEGLSVISSGTPTPNAGVLIESAEAGSFITELTTQFDMVIIDSAPVLVKSDALVLSKHVDGQIMVIESEKTTRGAVRELLEILAETNIKPLGFILNRFSIRKGQHFYHHYYYGYHGRDLLAGETV